MGADRTEIRLAMLMLTDAATTQVAARLRYRSTEPYAVTLVFDGHASPIEWMFARDLLADGLGTASGDGDVRIWPAETNGPIFFELRSPSGRAVFAADRDRIERFLARSQQIVPSGHESVVMAVDHHLAALLGGEPGLAPPELR